MASIGVLGAGLQGVCTALEFARRGHEVVVFERETEILSGASANNEGKLHLGFVYANDQSFDTARLMMTGALAFAPLMRTWIGDAVDGITVSGPFHYAVHRDSLVSADDLQPRYDAMTGLIRDRLGGAPADYFGADPGGPMVRASQAELERWFDPRHVAGLFQSSEIALDPKALTAALASAVAAEPRVRIVTGATVSRVRPEAEGVEVVLEGGDAARFDHVVNASWDGLLAIDATAGLEPPPGWSFRDKHALRIRCRAVSPMPTVTVVLGGFGDVVNYGDGELYLSWYPVGRRSLSSSLVAPSRELLDGQRDPLVSGTVEALAELIPAVSRLSAEELATARICGGVILATGRTDVDDPGSLLHQRTNIGIRSLGRYHSVNTGKLTMAPWFARQLAERVCG